MSVLFPEGVHSLTELPHTTFAAIRNALIFLKFQEMEEDEAPPREIWLDDKRLKAHMEMVKRMRRAKYGGDEGDIRDVPIEGPVERNAIMDELGLTT